VGREKPWGGASGTRGRDGREGREWRVMKDEGMSGIKMGRGEYCFMLSGGIDATD